MNIAMAEQVPGIIIDGNAEEEPPTLAFDESQQSVFKDKRPRQATRARRKHAHTVRFDCKTQGPEDGPRLRKGGSPMATCVDDDEEDDSDSEGEELIDQEGIEKFMKECGDLTVDELDEKIAEA